MLDLITLGASMGLQSELKKVRKEHESEIFSPEEPVQQNAMTETAEVSLFYFNFFVFGFVIIYVFEFQFLKILNDQYHNYKFKQ